MKVAHRGGNVAKSARDMYEHETKKSAISKSNTLPYKYIDNDLIENNKVNNNQRNIQKK